MLLLLACIADDKPADTAGAQDSPPADTAPALPPAPPQFRFPLPDPALFTQKIGVDHDPAEYEGAGDILCADYIDRPFPWCYDGHDGSDFMLDGGFPAMDTGSVQILAAADGTVIDTADGNYDRCHATVNGIDCDGWPQAANYVIVEHEGGWRSMYWHMKSGSVLVTTGQAVTCGEPLGLVGSSGNSSAPHLHFELQDSAGTSIDPYAGPRSQPETWWTDQGDPEGFPGLACAAD